MAPTQRFKDQIVWVTGASSGIGEALAYAFAREGAQLVLSARRLPELERVRANCASPERVEVVPLDMTDFADLQGTAATVLQRFGRIDVLVHNAGISQRSLARDTDFEVDRAILNTNTLGVICLTKALLPSMLAGKNGHFVVVSSLVGYAGTPLRSGYAASKHALHGFFESLRAETWRDGITITMVCPGFIRTNLSLNALVGDGSPQGKMDHATASGMSPEECARRILEATVKRKAEIFIGGKEKLAVYLRRWWPNAYRLLVRKVKVT